MAQAVLRELGKRKVRAELMDCQEVPENFLERIVRRNPNKVIILDSCEFGGEPGSFGIIRRRIKAGLTHNSTALFMRYLEKSTSASIILVGIQPKQTEFGRGLSKELEAKVPKIADFVESILY